MSQVIAEFFAKITADTTGLKKGLSEADKGLEGLAKNHSLPAALLGD
jgi:hypothetical protein